MADSDTPNRIRPVSMLSMDMSNYTLRGQEVHIPTADVFATLSKNLDVANNPGSKFCDFTFIVGPNQVKVPVPKVIIGLRSSVFGDLLYGMNVDPSMKEMAIPHAPVEPFKVLCRFLVSGVIDDSPFGNQTFNINVARIGREYNAPQLSAYAEQKVYTSITIENSVETLKYSFVEGDDLLRKQVAKFLQKNSGAFLNSKFFLLLDFETLLTVLEIVHDQSAFQTLKSTVEWSKQNKGTDEQITKIFSFISFDKVANEELVLLEEFGAIGKLKMFEIFKAFLLKPTTAPMNFNLTWENTPGSSLIVSPNQDWHHHLTTQSITSGVLIWELEIMETGVRNGTELELDIGICDANIYRKLQDNVISTNSFFYRSMDELTDKERTLKICKKKIGVRESFVTAFADLPRDVAYAPALCLTAPQSAKIKFIERS
ncbi:hypothetical protein HK099_000021 [Clydaea vesicula]|uniref:BTB domain-containing protein n=1 Tax=Clydaea vesicula TaxID=447962 RepID=A0AAD5Y245_9FUNG|nr:hypothetical protein HK099_000021 [Clydaea vesicula]KAJ3395441.1 hypothetical protein HDU92_005831 [Lobulomyces angularis]